MGDFAHQLLPLCPRSPNTAVDRPGETQHETVMHSCNNLPQLDRVGGKGAGHLK